MADLAFLFGWPPSELWDLDLADLHDWRERAQRRMPRG